MINCWQRWFSPPFLFILVLFSTFRPTFQVIFYKKFAINFLCNSIDSSLIEIFLSSKKAERVERVWNLTQINQYKKQNPELSAQHVSNSQLIVQLHKKAFANVLFCMLFVSWAVCCVTNTNTPSREYTFCGLRVKENSAIHILYSSKIWWRRQKPYLISFIANGVRSMQHKCRFVESASDLRPYKCVQCNSVADKPWTE